MTGPSGFLPLTEATFYVLVALAEPLHGYGIMQSVHALTDSRVALGPGTLYGVLSSLEGRKLIRRVGGDGAAGAGDRRKTYALTEAGQALILTEIDRLEEMVKNGRSAFRESDRPSSTARRGPSEPRGGIVRGA